jgi:hypothetical protein
MANEALLDLEGHADPPSKNESPERQLTEPKSSDVVDFDGPEDPQNPQNWSSARKITSIAIISCLTFVL